MEERQEVDIRELNTRIERESSFVDMLSLELSRVIVGQRHLVESLLIGLLADGHILLEGVPGLAKTLGRVVLMVVLQEFSLPPTSYLPTSLVR